MAVGIGSLMPEQNLHGVEKGGVGTLQLVGVAVARHAVQNLAQEVPLGGPAQTLGAVEAAAVVADATEHA